MVCKIFALKTFGSAVCIFFADLLHDFHTFLTWLMFARGKDDVFTLQLFSAMQLTLDTLNLQWPSINIKDY